MRIVLQRVSSAQVEINKKCKSKINNGFLILLGICADDDHTDIDWSIKKVLGMRVFSDDQGKMNLSIRDINGQILIISQFTLYASTKKGNRPGFTNAAKPEIAIPLYNRFVKQITEESQLKVGTGEFGADMKVSLLNDGPVTIILDSKNKE